MSRLENLGPTGEPIGDVPAAEFVDVSARSGAAQHVDTEESIPRGELWRIMPLPLKIIIVTSPVWLVAMCASMSSGPSSPELTPEQLVNATDMAEVAEGSAAAGTPLYLDDLASDADGTCAGKFIWSFNIDGETGTVSLRDEQGTAITSGKYTLTEQNLRLTGLVERKPGGSSESPVKNVTYHIGRTAEGRIIIGKKDYRSCTPKPDTPTFPPAADAPAEPPAPPQYAPQPIPAAPARSLTPDEACEELSSELKQIIESNSNGLWTVIEASAREGMSSVKEDGTLSCYASVITNRGTLHGAFGTSYTPKGQLLVTWRADDFAAGYVERGL